MWFKIRLYDIIRASKLSNRGLDMKEMTPMKKLQGNFKIFRDLTENMFKEVTLNKSSPKSYRYGWDRKETKGVDNDFTMLFGLKNGVQYPSFAFVFDYLESSRPQTIVAQMKNDENNNTIVSSIPMTVEEFRAKINQFNKEIANDFGKCQLKDVIKFAEKFGQVFLNDTLDLNKQIESASKEVKEFIKLKEKEFDIDGLNKSVKESGKELDEALAQYTKELKKSPITKEIEELEKRMNELKGMLETKKVELTNKHNIKELTQKHDKAKKELKTNEEKLNQEFEEKKNQYMGSVRNNLRV